MKEQEIDAIIARIEALMELATIQIRKGDGEGVIRTLEHVELLSLMLPRKQAA